MLIQRANRTKSKYNLRNNDSPKKQLIHKLRKEFERKAI